MLLPVFYVVIIFLAYRYLVFIQKEDLHNILSKLENSHDYINHNSWSNIARRVLSIPVNLVTLCDVNGDGICFISTQKTACGIFVGESVVITSSGSLTCSSGLLQLQLSGNFSNEGSISTASLQTNFIEVNGTFTNEVMYEKLK